MVTLPGNVDSTSLAAFIKENYPPARIVSLALRGHPVLQDIKHEGNLGGSGSVIPFLYGRPNTSNAFIAALNKRKGTSSKKFTLTESMLYGIGEIDCPTMLKMQSDEYAFAQALDIEIKGMVESMREDSAQQFFRSADGWITTVVSVATNTITLPSKSDVWLFHENQELVAADEADGGTPRSGGDYQINALDPVAATITVDDATNIVAGDYLFNYGNEADTTNDGVGSATGFYDWIPPQSGGAPTDTLFGCARTGNPYSYGHGITNTNISDEESLYMAGSAIASSTGAGGKLIGYCHPERFRYAVEEFGAKAVREAHGEGRAGYRSITVETAAGPIELKPEPATPETMIAVCDVETWGLKYIAPKGSKGNMLHRVMEDGLEILRSASTDAVQFRMRQMWQPYTNAPIRNVHIERNSVT